MTNLNRSDDNDLLVALRHPLRRDILRVMAGEKAISPRQIASALHQPLSNVSYHVRVLADCAAVSLVNTKPVRGLDAALLPFRGRGALGAPGTGPRRPRTAAAAGESPAAPET